MAMTDAQLQVYSDSIAANTDPTVVNAVAAGDHQAIAEWYNDVSIPDVWTLVSSISRTGMIASMDWPNEYDPGFKDDIEAIIFITGDSYDPRPVESRNALNAAFSGAPNTKAGILGLATALTSYVRALFIQATTGPGGGDGSSNANAALDILNEDVSVDDTRTAVLMI